MPILLQTNPSFIDQAANELPTKTVDDIEHHEQWYTEYCTLLERKKLAIEAWKVERKVNSAHCSIMIRVHACATHAS